MNSDNPSNNINEQNESEVNNIEETGIPSEHKEKNQKKFTRWMPCLIEALLIAIGAVLNWLLLKATMDDRLFMLGRMNPQFMVRVIYGIWTLGIVAFPLSVYYAINKKKKVFFFVTFVVTLLLACGCTYLSAMDEMRVLGGSVASFEYYTDGTYRMVIKNCTTISGTNLQHFYIQDDKYYYAWYAGGTEHAVVEWREDGAAIVEDGNDCVVYSYDLFYEN